MIFAHRGWWTSLDERNSRAAFQRAFAHGYGVETDVRDRNGALVVSHDLPVSDALMSFAELLDLHRQAGHPGRLALNIKADGLQDLLCAGLAALPEASYFVFDMAVPDAILYLRRGMVAYTRQSEYESVPSFYDEAQGVWLDAFDRDWFGLAEIERHLAAGKQVALVSPELHRRPCETAWEAWRPLARRVQNGMLAVCTDFPDLADRYFND